MPVLLLGPGMTLLTRLTTRLQRSPARRRTIRLRLTALYGGLFLLCGTAMLAITYVLFKHAISGGYAYQGAGGEIGVVGSGTGKPPPSGEQLHLHSGAQPLTSAQAEALADRLHQLAIAQQAHELRQLLVGSGIALAIMVLVAVGLGWLVAGRVLQPLRTITEATHRISEQNLHERLALPGPDDELKTLGATIDALLARLESAFDAQRRFVANASHELRTPLTMMRTALDVATAKPKRASPEIRTLAGKITLGLDKADCLVESFLILARAQHNDPVPDSADGTPLALDNIAGQAISDRHAAITSQDLTVTQDCRHALVKGSPVLLAHLVENLIDNAVRHNRPGGWITVTTRADAGSAVLTVENAGPRLDQHEVDQLAQPFRRLAPDRTSTDGVGLGLSIVAAITDTCGGTLALRARSSGGLCVEVTLQTADRVARTSVAATAGSNA